MIAEFGGCADLYGNRPKEGLWTLYEWRSVRYDRYGRSNGMGAIFCSPRVVAHTRGTFLSRLLGSDLRTGFRYGRGMLDSCMKGFRSVAYPTPDPSRSRHVRCASRDPAQDDTPPGRAEAPRLSEGPHRRTPESEIYILPERATKAIQNMSTLNVIQ